MADNVILLSGGRTTQPLAKPLAKMARIAVLDRTALSAFISQLDEVLCPENGIGPELQSRATNDAARFSAQVTGMLPMIAPRFSIDGVAPPVLKERLGNWLPGLTLTIFSILTRDLHVLDAFCKSVNVRVAVVHEDVTPRFRALAMFARTQGIPTVHIPHANHFIQARPDIHDKCLCDWILAASPWMRKWYVERGYPKEQVKVIGCPNWDKWQKINATISKDYARTVLHLAQDVPVVLYCTSWPQTTNLVDDHTVKDRADAAMLEAAKREGWQLMWSLHPGDPAEWQKRYAEMAKEAGVPAVIVKGHLPYTMKAADAVLAVGPSNVIVEAAMAGVPAVTIPLRGYGFPSEPPWKADPTEDGIIDAVNYVLGAGDAWEVRRLNFVRRFAHSADGNASARAAEAIREIAGL